MAFCLNSAVDYGLLTQFRIFNIILMGKIPHHDDHMAVKSDINEINTSAKSDFINIYLA